MSRVSKEQGKKQKKDKNHRHLNVSERQEVLDLIDKKVSYREISEKFGIAVSTVSNVKKQRHPVKEHQEKNFNIKSKRLVNDTDINQRVYEKGREISVSLAQCYRKLLGMWHVIFCIMMILKLLMGGYQDSR